MIIRVLHANNAGADQPVQSRNFTNTFGIRSLKKSN